MGRGWGSGTFPRKLQLICDRFCWVIYHLEGSGLLLRTIGGLLLHYLFRRGVRTCVRVFRGVRCARYLAVAVLAGREIEWHSHR